MILINSSSALADLCDRLASAPYVTVDTEFMRERTFWPQLCLVQIAGPHEAAVIDPLAPNLDLSPLFALMANKAVLKVFHAARQDVEIFVHLSGAVPTPLFDTQVAAMVCGFGDSASYETLVSKIGGGAHLDKSSRFTDWAARPLTDRQLEYALGDVTHLRVVYESLCKQLEKNGRAAWLADEMAILNNIGTYIPDPDKAWQRLKMRNAKPKALAILKVLAAWRDHEAQSRDLPRSRILRDEALIEIATHAPTTIADLARTRGLGAGVADGKFGHDILAAVTKGLKLPPAECPRTDDTPDLPHGLGPVVELLRVLLKMVSDESGVAARLIANSSDLDLIAADDNADVPALSGWRREIFGESALALKHGKLGLGIVNHRVHVFPLKKD